MAGEWLKMECATPDKPEVFAITAQMGWDDPDLAVGKLFRVWRWFDQQTVDGNARGVTPALLDRIAGATGFAQAMLDVSWLLVSEAGLQLANFDKHNGATAKGRAQTAKRVSAHRAVAGCNAVGNGAGVTGALPREEKKRDKDIPPAGAAGSLPAEPKPKTKRPPTITEWLDSLGDADAIPADDPVYAYAEKAGIPDDFLLLSWAEFKSAYTASGKRQKDFPATYRNAVKGNWYKLWWITPDGEYRLTTAGEQAKRAQA